MSRLARVGLPLLLFVELALVLGVFVASPHPGGDNAGYVALADALVSGEGYTEVWDPERPPHTKYPPVFPVLLGLALLLGASGWTGLKAVSVVAALVAVGCSWLWARRRVGDGPAFGAALLVGLSPALVYHAHWVLSDVPFLAFLVAGLWLLEPRVPGNGDVGEPEPGVPGGEGAEATGATAGSLPGGLSRREWAGIVAVVLAALTRTAGVPLAVAAVGALLLARRIRAGLVAGVVAGLPLAAWVIRGRLTGPGEGRYGSEFFLLDPYNPDLGRAGVGDFVSRFGENLSGYLGRWLPEALVGTGGGWPALVVGALAFLALAGWGLRIRAAWRPQDGGGFRVGAAELFLPLYTGIILLWPAVWSGDRFALPLVPLVLVYAVEALGALLERAGRSGWRGPVLAGAGLLVLLPAAADWGEARAEAAACRGTVAAAGPWACGGGALVDFAAAARWAGEAQGGPEAVPALTRKPRIWYLESGIPTRTYPFTESPGALLADAEAVGAGWVVLDFVGSQGVQYVGAAVSGSPERFCQAAAVGGDRSIPATRVLRILPPGRPSGTRVEDGALVLAGCGAEGGSATVPRPTGPGLAAIPLLRR